MAENDICAKFQEEINALCDDPDALLLAHISECAECAEHYKKLLEMRELLSKSAPTVPDLRSAVIRRIASENIPVAPVYRRRRIPFGTVAAAAAILAVFAVSYGVKTPDGIFSQSKNSAENDCAPMAETQMFSATSGADGVLFDAVGNSESSKITYFSASDSGLGATEETVEAEIESAPEENIAEPEIAAVTESDGADAPDEKTKLMFAVSPEKKRTKSDIVAEYKAEDAVKTESDGGEKPDGTQSADVDNVNAPILSENGENISTDAKTVHKEVSETPVGGQTGETSGSGGASGGGASDGAASGGGGGSSAAQQNVTADGSALKIAKDIYDVMKIVYPDRISPEVFESVGAEAYLAFIESIEDPDTGYTEQALIAFAESYTAQNEK